MKEELLFKPFHKNVILAEPDIVTTIGTKGTIEKPQEAIEKEKIAWAREGKPFRVLAVGPDIPEGVLEVGDLVSTFAVSPIIIGDKSYLKTDYHAITGKHA